MAMLAIPLAKKALSVACDQGTKQLGDFVKDTVRTHQAQICSPEFPSLLTGTMLEQMKASRFFPGKVREYLEGHPEVLTSFATELVAQPEFKDACASQHLERMDSIIDARLGALKSKLMICSLGGRRKTRKGKKARKTRRRSRNVPRRTA
jgi:hypothetical protein